MIELNKRIIRELQKGLPLTEKPYLHIAQQAECTETEVIDFIKQRREENIISRFGLIVNHRRLGYCHNAMVVWDIPNDQVDLVARKIADYTCVNLCYGRPRALPQWPYNLFCMIHAKSREFVHQTLSGIRSELNIEQYPHAILFSEKAFKQKGAKYV